MTPAAPSFVIVGANLTGGAAATTLRADGFDGPIVMIGAEPLPPYERPPLSKEYLRGTLSFADALLRPPEWYPDNGVDLLLGRRAAGIDTERRVVELDDAEVVPYGAVLVATGGRNRTLEVSGAGLDAVLDLRTVGDADRIRAEASRSRTAVVVGAGFIGCEVAASLRQMGLDVEVVEIFDTTLLRVLGAEVGGAIEAVHRDHGVRFHFGEVVERFEGPSGGRVERVITSHGTVIECDMAVVGVGIVPNTEVVDGSGVTVDNGIAVDAWCRTNVPGIYAAGDVANHDHPLFGRHLRVEHWDNALKQGAAAARTMMADQQDPQDRHASAAAAPFDDTHWFWSDQFGANVQYAGYAPEWDELVFRGSVKDRSFAAFYVQGGVVRAVAGVNRGKDVRRATGLIRAGRPVDFALLANEDVDLRKLAAAAAADPA